MDSARLHSILRKIGVTDDGSQAPAATASSTGTEGHLDHNRRRRARLLAVCALCAAIGVASKYHSGPGRGVVVGQGEDFFGTVFLILFPRVAFLHAALWRIVAAILTIVVAIELSQLFHGGWLDRARSSWLGLRILGSSFEWADMLAYALAAGAAVWIDRWLTSAGTADLGAPRW